MKQYKNTVQTIQNAVNEVGTESRCALINVDGSDVQERLYLLLLPYLLAYFLTNLPTYLLTYLLTPYSTGFLEKLTGLQPVKKFPVFHGTRRLITAFTCARHQSLSWASSMQPITPYPISRRTVLILRSHLRLGLPSGLFPSGHKLLYRPESVYFYSQTLPADLLSGSRCALIQVVGSDVHERLYSPEPV
jgi:hypothetical protein